MGRIPESEIGRIKKEVSVKELAEAKGVDLKQHGKDLIGLCPFHDDKTPSLVITPEKNLWHCLGACNTGGSPIDWVMKDQGVSFRHAVELLRNNPFSLAVAKPVQYTHLPMDVDDQELLNRVTGFYHDTLKQSPEALSYLKGRGLTHPEMIDHFRLGFANRTLAYRLPPKQNKTGAKIRGQLQKTGILKPTGHEHFNGSLVIPVFDEAGSVVEVYGRKIRDDLRKGTPTHLYLPGPHAGVWNIEAFKASEEIILCEALIDALTFWCAGFRHVTASYGVSGFTKDMEDAFKTNGIKRVLIAYDRDKAGDDAAQKIAERFLDAGIDCYRILFPKNMDANEYSLNVKPAEKSLGVVIRNAEWMGKGKNTERPIAAKETIQSPASPESAPLSMDIPMKTSPKETVFQLGDRRYRVRGLSKNTGFDQLRVNIMVSREADCFVDTLDLYVARSRAAYINQAAKELNLKEDVIKKDLGKVLFKLEAVQEDRIKKAMAPKETIYRLSPREEADAMALLKSPNLLARILKDFDQAGLVGEDMNKLIGYLAAVSRKLEKPLAVIVQSCSAAGKSLLMESILSFMPREEQVKYSAMTGQSLFYMSETNLKHKILGIVEEEGAERASYALKLLQSEGELKIASTGKDPATGKLVTQEYCVQGPVMVFLTTTNIDIDEEFLNRCIVLTINEDRNQTKAIHQYQRQAETLEGQLAGQERADILKLHQNAQRLLKPMIVVNDYAPALTFPDNCTRTRRDHMKYLTLIRTIAFLHQYQRPVKTAQKNGKTIEYIEVVPQDIDVANRIAGEVLGRSLDELPPQTRNLLNLIDRMVTEACKRLNMDRPDYRFSRRDIREYTGWGNTQLKVHLNRLQEMEYLIVHRGGRGQRYVYELLYNGECKNGESFLPGLIDVGQLKSDYDKKKSGGVANRSGANENIAPPGRGQVGPLSGGGRGGKIPVNDYPVTVPAELASNSLKKHYTGHETNHPVVT